MIRIKTAITTPENRREIETRKEVETQFAESSKKSLQSISLLLYLSLKEPLDVIKWNGICFNVSKVGELMKVQFSNQIL